MIIYLTGFTIAFIAHSWYVRDETNIIRWTTSLIVGLLWPIFGIALLCGTIYSFIRGY